MLLIDHIHIEYLKFFSVSDASNPSCPTALNLMI